VTINAAAGSTYCIRVAGFNGAFGDYVLNAGPTNDRCDEAMVITPGTYPFDNRHTSTDRPVLNQCTNNDADNQINGDLWYVYTPTQSGTINVATCGSSFDTRLAVYANPPCGPRFTYKACNDDDCGFQRRSTASKSRPASPTTSASAGTCRPAAQGRCSLCSTPRLATPTSTVTGSWTSSTWMPL
jgi:hypothetical protein